ncbi:MAG TPA: class I adenylate-forming enzyme family protein [Gemmatimonadales bacterium]|nr:class I adenylate-forming enzyme family protein [Gemmatimonadales bacterium]
MTASIADRFRETAAQRPSHTALVFLGERVSYRRLDLWSDALAGALAARGVDAGDRVLLYAPHCPQWVVSWLALQKLGAVVVPVTHFYGPSDLRYIARDSGAETAICMDTNFGHLDKVLKETPIRQVVVTGIADLLPLWKRVVGHVLDRIPRGRVRAGADVLSFRALLDEDRPCPQRQVGGGAIAELLYTGGTTGFPKGVPINHALFLESCAEQRRASLPAAPAGTEVILQGALLYHILGQVVGLGGLLTGETVILLPKNQLDAVFDHVERYRATTILGTPAFYRMMLEHDRIDQYRLHSLRFAFSGGDALPPETAARWKKLTGHPLYQGYGATETCGGVALPRAGEAIPDGSVGRVCAHQRVLVVHPGTTAEVAPGEPGELLVSSRNMVTGYWNNPEERARCFVEIGGQAWYRTGDVVRIDAGGWMFFQDRSVDVIKHKGYRVAASKVDNVLQEHHAVVASCTIGVPDPDVGERIKSFVVTRSDVKGVNAEELIRWCRERLAPYEVPQYVEFRDMLPRSKVGKLLRRELRSEEKRKVEGWSSGQSGA